MEDQFYPCSECGSLEKIKKGDALPLNGFFFSPRQFGYYAGFSDTLPWQGDNDEDGVFFCHNCCVRLLVSFPSIERAIGKGGHHPCNDEIPCCSYAWQGTEVFGSRPNEFLVRTRHPVVDEVTKNLRWQDDEPQDAFGNTATI